MATTFRIWCNTENDHVYVESETIPTECPNDAGHDIDEDKTSRIKAKRFITVDPTNGPTIKMKSPDGATEKELAIDDDGHLRIGDEHQSPVRVLNYVFTRNNRSYLTYTKTSYTVVCRFIFCGTDRTGPSVGAKMLTKLDSGTDYDIRIVRSDTGDVICEMTGNTNTEWAIVGTQSMSNLPTDSVPFELQIKGNASIANMVIGF